MKDLAVELNRVNGSTGLSAIVAANQWANHDERPYWSLVEALNQKNSTATKPFLSLNAVLNDLANTSGLSNIRAAEELS